ncbi:uncharacterized protein ACNS7B_009631 isoform 1-T1 [Menidia menidia]
MESKHLTSHIESFSGKTTESPPIESNCSAAAPIRRYHSVMDDEGADDVFVHPTIPPQRCLAPLLAAKGSPGATDSNSVVTPSNGAADATEAKANPAGLDWHHSEKQLMAARNEPDEVISGTEQCSRQPVDSRLLLNDKGSAEPAYQRQTSTDIQDSLMEACHGERGKQYQNRTSEHEGSNGEPEDIVVLNKEDRHCGETGTEEDKYPRLPPDDKETSENGTWRDKESDISKDKDSCCLDERHFEMPRDNLDSESVETNAPSLPGLRANDDDFESSEPAELYKCKQDLMGEVANKPLVSAFPANVTNDSEGQGNSRSSDYNLRRESDTAEMQVNQLPIDRCSEEMVEQVDGTPRIATVIQQGEQLLQRLQIVQLRHDEVQTPPQDTVKGVTGGEEFGTSAETEGERVTGMSMAGEEEEEERRFLTDEDDEVKTTLMQNDEDVSKQLHTKAGASLSPTQTSDSEDDQSNSLVPSDLSLETNEVTSTERQLTSTEHRFSVGDSSMERHIHEVVAGKQNLQRAGGVFNLADDPDVLEIPFKTNLSLESALTKACTSQPNHWQFSEKQMQKDISHDTQRELAMVNQGKIPGGYSKGETRQLKETKLLFEAFQHDNTDGPTRLRKAPATLIKAPVYPSVLERTRSLERFSHKSSPVSRTQSLRLDNSGTLGRDKSPENLRSRSPTAASRDKTRLSPYPKQDKHLRLHRSMESIQNEVSKSAAEMRGESQEARRRPESPVLKHNPFFKLRPALALQPEVAKDIREAKEREEELRRQRSTLYGEYRRSSEDEESSQSTKALVSDSRQQSRGKLERVWPPPSKKDQKKCDQSQQDAKVHKAGGQKTPLWQRWESGMINGQAPNEKK